MRTGRVKLRLWVLFHGVSVASFHFWCVMHEDPGNLSGANTWAPGSILDLKGKNWAQVTFLSSVVEIRRPTFFSYLC